MALAVDLSLCLPRAVDTVSTVRLVVRTPLQQLHVSEVCRSAIELAVTEACTNVLDHADGTDEYDVRVHIDARRCEVHVVDTGPGFDVAALTEIDPEALSGRGVAIMRALMDEAEWRSGAGAGTAVRLVKELGFDI